MTSTLTTPTTLSGATEDGGFLDYEEYEDHCEESPPPTDHQSGSVVAATPSYLDVADFDGEEENEEDGGEEDSEEEEEEEEEPPPFTQQKLMSPPQYGRKRSFVDMDDPTPPPLPRTVEADDDEYDDVDQLERFIAYNDNHPVGGRTSRSGSSSRVNELLAPVLCDRCIWGRREESRATKVLTDRIEFLENRHETIIGELCNDIAQLADALDDIRARLSTYA